MINFSETQPLHLDIAPDDKHWGVLLSTHHPQNQQMGLPKTLAPFEVSILQAE